MGLLGLLVSALMPVLKVLSLTAIGTFLATERVDILGLEARKHMNNLVFFVFDPSLVGSSLAKFITLKSISTLWFMPLNILLTFIVGSALGWLIIKLTRAPRHLRGIVLGSCAAGNLGNLPLIIVPAVCKERESPFGNVELCQEHGLAYISLSMAIATIYMWTYVYNIIRLYAGNNTSGGAGEDDSTSCAPPPIDSKDCELNGGGSLDGIHHSDSNNLPITEGNRRKEKENGRTSEMMMVSIEKMKKQLTVAGKKLNLKRLLAPSTCGAIIGFMIGGIRPFRKAFIGDHAPLRVIEDSAYLLGQAAISCPTLIVGANLLKGLKGSVKSSVIVGIILVRYVLLPIIGVVTVKSAVHLGLVKRNPLYEFVLMLQHALPPAISIGTMTQLFGAGESDYSVIMLSTYVLASVSITLWCMFFMWVVR